MGQKQSLGDVIFDMKIKSKEMQKFATKCTKEERAEKLKVKKALEANNVDSAQLYAQNAIRKRHESLNCLKLSSKLDTVATQLETADRSQSMNKSLCQAVPSLSKAMNTLNIEKLSESMVEFEKVLEDLDVRSEYVANTVDATAASTTPPDQVKKLIAEVAEEHALDVSRLVEGVPSHSKLGIDELDVAKRMEKL
ncbi:SNF7 family protein [Cardiosporidium cionae]|uniref:SNF7 family protein n=1 Tax=Cardiosporidium cionae TaxID=476202 RepID=A0ABQ7JAV1_9APIC|nr:SNF7 family protein [Cardiosporidium cionae]|eukprot:KAF8821126.1 SNF7 family protein [Cardiosporidium cionae]